MTKYVKRFKMRKKMNIPILTKLTEARVDPDGCLVEGVILTSGISENGTYYTPEVVEGSVEVFRNVHCYADHPSQGETERSVRDVVGQIENTWADDGNLRATIKLSRAHDWLLTMISEGLVGDLSINALGKTRVARHDGRVVREVLEISKAHSVDFVARAAAGGHVEKILHESESYGEGLRLLENISIKELTEARPDLVEILTDRIRLEFTEANEEGISEASILEEEIEKHRSSLNRELCARKLVNESGLPGRMKNFLLKEALMVTADSDESYEGAVETLIEKHRNLIAGLSEDGVIKGMGASKDGHSELTSQGKQTLKLMGIG